MDQRRKLEAAFAPTLVNPRPQRAGGELADAQHKLHFVGLVSLQGAVVAQHVQAFPFPNPICSQLRIADAQNGMTCCPGQREQHASMPTSAEQDKGKCRFH